MPRLRSHAALVPPGAQVILLSGRPVPVPSNTLVARRTVGGMELAWLLNKRTRVVQLVTASGILDVPERVQLAARHRVFKVR